MELKLRQMLVKKAKEKGLSLQKISKRVGISRQTLSEWCLGRTPRDLVAVKKVSEVLDISLHELLFGEAEGQAQKIFDHFEAEGIFRISIKRINSEQRRN